MVEGNDGTPLGENFLNQSWVKALIEADVFEGDPSNWKITERNYKEVLQALGVNVHQFIQSLKRAITNSNDQLPFNEFCTLWQKEFIKAAAYEVRFMDD